MNKIISIVITVIMVLAGIYLLGTLTFDSDFQSELQGKWVGESKAIEDASVVIELNITTDGNVYGNVGGAKFENGFIRKNRNSIGERLGINSDYIIVDGTLKGQITEDGKSLDIMVNIPFDFNSGIIDGGINLKKPFTYPDPIVRDMELRLWN
ncbi:MAG: hypothetical protein IBX70_11390 [Clostridia bacterium]|nr:hypothetical protein [Clostridia bacterium]